MASVYEDIQALFGKESPPETGVDGVSKEMIRHWCEAMEDGNPLYTDEGYAKKANMAVSSHHPRWYRRGLSALYGPMGKR